MYANLSVSIGVRPLDRDASGRPVYEEEVFAWSVEVDGQVATIKLDANDGESKYSVPAGERVVDLKTHAIAIGADF